ncbi:serine hydrolase FSH [Clohesyomyces aquaticus]|uniref:Serine hydrolase FSH n=1 Tax=Clohesyomyces aquaticus TaxID=1231657 RepID=A0A1Y2A5U4_9PLEO|nr:serine hydrolase FSH [Clohesyomyces aquaticus]
MRFLCLHGKGTTSMILETQFAAVRYQLGDGHSFEFVEGTVPESAAPELQSLSSRSEKYFGYFDESSPASCVKALNDLARYIEVRGPFDGVVAFSQGAALVSTLLVPESQQVATYTPFKLAIFFSGGIPAHPELLKSGVIKPLTYEDAGEVIQIPTAHIWGSSDQGELEWPSQLRLLCHKESREEFRHNGGHQIPGSKDRAGVTGAVQAIRRTVWRAERLQDS